MVNGQCVGILHPGDMGISVAATIRNSGYEVCWCSEGRSEETRARAEKHNLRDMGSLSDLCQACSFIVSVCPPHAAEALARAVSDSHFTGLYLDANAISPVRATHIAQVVAGAGARFVDGGIIGGPAWKPGTTRLYLSGESAQEATDLFSAGPLEAVNIGGEIGKASALKMCYAAYTKGTTALLAAALAAAESLDVRAELENQWSHEGSDLAEGAGRRVRQVTAKAWRFAGEMEEIAATLESAGVPDGFHRAAADIYHRMADFKGAPELPSLAQVLRALLNPDADQSDNVGA